MVDAVLKDGQTEQALDRVSEITACAYSRHTFGIKEEIAGKPFGQYGLDDVVYLVALDGICLPVLVYEGHGHSGLRPMDVGTCFCVSARSDEGVVKSAVDEFDLYLYIFRGSVLHLVRNVVIKKVIRVVEHDLFVETPVKRLQQGGLAIGIVPEYHSHVLLGVSRKGDRLVAPVLSEVVEP